jgi:hypothetical protein
MRRGALLTIVAALVVAVPAALLVWMRAGSEDRLSALDPEPVAIVVPVELRDVVDETAVTVESVWGVPPAIVAPTWSGTVTRVLVNPLDEVVSGDVVARVDGVDRVAVATRDPFFRELRRRDVGDDVAMLQQWLAMQGLYEGEIDGVFGSDLVDGVKTWAELLGVRKPNGAFDPAWVVWLPDEPFGVDRVHLVRGEPAPGAGADILAGPVPLESVTILDQEGRRFGPDGLWVLEVNGIEVQVDSGEIDAEGLSALAGVLDPDEPVASARTRRAVAIETLEVPATAVMSNAAGDLCVFVPGGSGYVPTAVVLSGGRVARVDIASGLTAGDLVLANPTDVLVDPLCP